MKKRRELERTRELYAWARRNDATPRSPSLSSLSSQTPPLLLVEASASAAPSASPSAPSAPAAPSAFALALAEAIEAFVSVLYRWFATAFR